MTRQSREQGRVFTRVFLLMAILATASAEQMRSSNNTFQRIGFPLHCPSGSSAGFSGGASPAPQGFQWTYLGCYRDKATPRALRGASFESSDMTMQSCQAFCWGKGYAFAATEYGSQCYCGDSFGMYGKALLSDCAMPCAGNPRGHCGGTWAESVYLLGRGGPSPASGPQPAFLGCYNDRAQRDLSGAHMEASDMTPDGCDAFCRSRGFLFAGTEYGTQCYCGNSFGTYGKAPGKCDMPCGGDPNAKCGGTWAIGVHLPGK